jgi:hypothetical protein
MNARNFTRAILLLVIVAAYPAAARAGFFDVGVSVGFAPPPLPVYVQPPCPSSVAALHLDARLLGLCRRRRLLLGAGHMGFCATAGAAVDTGLLVR